ncbi:MAG: hypothetical protein EA381_13955 [Planctomycetaceae bacterium]|nr:MAG: hypothetical protein EA381_13955 [Planctomycetaceae bacterium]
MDDTIKRLILAILLGVACESSGQAEEVSNHDLPFDRERINRYSLDHLPRSISIRQGADVWLGYDLPRATIYKVWRAPDGEAGLKQSGFVTRSVGKTLFEDKSDESWELRRGGETTPLSIRYLGCSEREGHFELRWELTHDADVMTLRERVPMTAESTATREIRVESLPTDSRLLLPLPAQKGWNLMTAEGTAASSLTDNEWYLLTSR